MPGESKRQHIQRAPTTGRACGQVLVGSRLRTNTPLALKNLVRRAPGSSHLVSSERLRLRLPDQCPACGAKGQIRVSSTIQDESVDLAWWCGACGYVWSIRTTDRELPERREGNADRRKNTRSDGRQTDE